MSAFADPDEEEEVELYKVPIAVPSRMDYSDSYMKKRFSLILLHGCLRKNKITVDGMTFQ